MHSQTNVIHYSEPYMPGQRGIAEKNVQNKTCPTFNPFPLLLMRPHQQYQVICHYTFLNFFSGARIDSVIELDDVHTETGLVLPTYNNMGNLIAVAVCVCVVYIH